MKRTIFKGVLYDPMDDVFVHENGTRAANQDISDVLSWYDFVYEGCWEQSIRKIIKCRLEKIFGVKLEYV